MISGSVAVEGGAARTFPGGGSEFLRPLPPASSYMRVSSLTLPGPEPEVPSSAPAYPPVPGAYARFLPHFYPYNPYQMPQPPSPLPQSHAHTQLQETLLQQSQIQQTQLQRANLQREYQRERESLLQRDREAFQLQREREAAAHQAVASTFPPPIAPPPPSPPSRAAPRGKEGSLKHRLLSRERPTNLGRFSKGALIQLGGGQLKCVEDMTTEDFVMSAEKSPELKLVDSTVVRLIRRPATDSVTLTLSYNSNTAQVDMETAVEHPYFVYGQGWASCSPERTFECYGLKVNRLQVGDICVSLVPREPSSPLRLHHHPPPAHHHSSQTIVTTATTTAMTVRPTEAPQRYPENLSLREDSRKRRSSAPDVVGDDNMKRSRTMPHL